VGAISKIRGVEEAVCALSLTKTMVTLNLCGKFDEVQVQESIKGLPGWAKVFEAGQINREGVRDVLARSIAGLVNFHPLPNHIDAQPNKMFEYMSAGIPVIASDFPLWREIIKGNDCGILIDPFDPAAIAQAIDHLVLHPADAQRMGANGSKAVNDRYNWNIEEKKLFFFYEVIFSRPAK
jgi:glycosyltransferase involved in cell wall biosynthesis